MTKEQIKQNAEAYAIKKTLTSTDSFHGMVENYLAGAHSRDEEIKELKEELETMTLLKNTFASALDIYDKDNKELQNKLELLSNS